jgi:hypothetical protein
MDEDSIDSLDGAELGGEEGGLSSDGRVASVSSDSVVSSLPRRRLRRLIGLSNLPERPDRRLLKCQLNATIAARRMCDCPTKSSG